MNPKQIFKLTRKVALISGASRGIGEAIALAYAKAGTKAVITSRKQEGLDNVAQKIHEMRGEVLAVAAHSREMTALNKV